MNQPQQTRGLGRTERSCKFRGKIGYVAGMILQRLPVFLQMVF